MPDKNPNDWKQIGDVFLWHYPGGSRNYCGWHLTADKAGANSLMSLLDAFRACSEYRRRKVRLSAPTQAMLAVPNYQAKHQAGAALEIKYLPGDEHSSQWKLSAEGGRVTVALGHGKLMELRQGLQDVAKGEGDYAIGPADKADWESMCLWFWWQPKQPRG